MALTFTVYNNKDNTIIKGIKWWEEVEPYTNSSEYTVVCNLNGEIM